MEEWRSGIWTLRRDDAQIEKWTKVYSHGPGDPLFFPLECSRVQFAGLGATRRMSTSTGGLLHETPAFILTLCGESFARRSLDTMRLNRDVIAVYGPCSLEHELALSLSLDDVKGTPPLLASKLHSTA